MQTQVQLDDAVNECKEKTFSSLDQLQRALSEAREAGLAESNDLYKLGKALLARAKALW